MPADAVTSFINALEACASLRAGVRAADDPTARLVARVLHETGAEEAEALQRAVSDELAARGTALAALAERAQAKVERARRAAERASRSADESKASLERCRDAQEIEPVSLSLTSTLTLRTRFLEEKILPPQGWSGTLPMRETTHVVEARSVKISRLWHDLYGVALTVDEVYSAAPSHSHGEVTLVVERSSMEVTIRRRHP